jgi:hypothetical protein
MLFENLNQFQAAKRTLLENNRNVKYTVKILKNSQLFSTLSEGEIILAVIELNEGLSDKIINFLSGSFGGDINSIKTVLTQMKEQELKYNKEEFEIYNKFYDLLEDQRALDRDKNNTDYQSLNKELIQSRNSLNTRMKELNKSHNEIFDALESKIKDLVKGNNRKKKYFNAQRATDVLETKNDRYEKIKSVTARSSKRTKELEDFFGVNTSKVKEEASQAKTRASREVNALSKDPNESGVHDGGFVNDPEKGFYENFQHIINKKENTEEKLKRLRLLEKTIFTHIMKGKHSDETIENLKNVHKQVSDKIQDLQSRSNN